MAIETKDNLFTKELIIVDDSTTTIFPKGLICINGGSIIYGTDGGTGREMAAQTAV
jgi:hypothetical protein